ncbi:Oligopeptide transport ATP-binding protein OppD [Nymphon striatum]|nr:Oligopeptide transport ATP-binding protein OppD [Nymphon striatum]
MALLLIIALLCVFGPFFSPWELDSVDWDNMGTAPDFESAHYFGTDSNGRDLFVRTLEGGRISLMVGLLATAVSFVIGIIYGSIAGYAGGKTDSIMMPSWGLVCKSQCLSWGVLIAEGAQQMESAPWMVLSPAIMLAVTLFCLNFIGDGLRDALDPKDSLDQGETVAIVGESGSGKSQLFNALMGLLPSNGNAQGSVNFNGQSLLNQPDHLLNNIRGKEIGMIFQDPMTALNPYLRIGKQLTEVLEIHEGSNYTKDTAKRRAIEMLERVKIKDPELRVVETGSVDEIFHHAQHPYTQALLAATPTNTEKTGKMLAIDGQPPDPLKSS